MQIVLCFPIEPQQVEQIRQAAPEMKVIDAGQRGIAREILNADIFCGHAKVPVPWDDVVRQGRLRWIQSSAAGLDHCLVPSVITSDILVSSASGLFANQVAEQTCALLYGLFRKLNLFIPAQQRKEFERLPTDDLHGKTIGIVGLGGNGRRIAEFLRPLGNRMIATDMFPVQKPEGIDQLWPHDQLHRLLAEADVVILCVPLNAQTQHLLSDREFDVMREQATLINVARGAVIDEAALVRAIQSGKLRSVGLDVTEVEPLDATSPLWEMPNVLITPHVGAQSHRRVSDTVDFFCENLRRFRQGEPILNLVDKQLGFPRREA
jgi:D-3-phosphoglycerate dehydrogenase